MNFKAIGGFPLMSISRVSEKFKYSFPENWLCNSNMMYEFVNDYLVLQ